MRYLALACDYDGTLATDGQIDHDTIAALERCRESGRRLLLVTGREMEELLRICPQLELFEWVVAENGALLYHPSDKQEKLLAARPADDFVNALAARGVAPVSVGRVIVATWEPHEAAVLQTIRDFGLELQVIFNKGAVMVLPTGINKATGLRAALKEMGLSPHNVVGVGDAENDHAFLEACEASAVVANALPQLKERADIVLAHDHGAGVQGLVEMLVQDDLASIEGSLVRHHILLGHAADGSELALPPYRENLLIAGTSGSGKSTLATAFVERMAESHFQFCILDPEGDYDDFLGAVAIGSGDQPVNSDELLRVLEDPNRNAVANLLGVPLADRPATFLKILTRLQELRARTGHPHWIIVDEAHHVLPSSYEPSALALPHHLDRVLCITLEPGLVAANALEKVTTVIAVGEAPEKTLADFAQVTGKPLPSSLAAAHDLQSGEVVVWRVHDGTPPFRIKVTPGRAERRRHNRKYAEGELEPDRSFYFRGPQGELKLRAQNLILFLQMGDGVDDRTWLHHLSQGDYSRWFREAIKDPNMAEEAEVIEKTPDLSANEGRQRIRGLVEKYYTLPGSTKSGPPADRAAAGTA